MKTWWRVHIADVREFGRISPRSGPLEPRIVASSINHILMLSSTMLIPGQKAAFPIWRHRRGWTCMKTNANGIQDPVLYTESGASKALWDFFCCCLFEDATLDGVRQQKKKERKMRVCFAGFLLFSCSCQYTWQWYGSAAHLSRTNKAN